jgi:CBS domain-containing protein
VGPEDSAFEALSKATRNQIGRLAVLAGSRLVGYVSLKDITHVLAVRGLPEGARSVQRAGAATHGSSRRAA